MPKPDAKKIGVTLGLIFALGYILWSIILSIGKQNVLDWIMKIHLINISITTNVAIENVFVGTFYHFLIGFFLGYLTVWLYNKWD